MRGEDKAFRLGTYGIRLSRHFAIPRRISIGTNIPTASIETARPTLSRKRAVAAAPKNITDWITSIVLNASASSFSMRRAAANLAAARELAIERTAELETGAAGAAGDPTTIAGDLFILGFLGFFGGIGCAHRTSGPMTRAFGLRPTWGARPGETFGAVFFLGIMSDYTGKNKKTGAKPVRFGLKARRKIP